MFSLGLPNNSNQLFALNHVVQMPTNSRFHASWIVTRPPVRSATKKHNEVCWPLRVSCVGVHTKLSFASIFANREGVSFFFERNFSNPRTMGLSSIPTSRLCSMQERAKAVQHRISAPRAFVLAKRPTKVLGLLGQPAQRASNSQPRGKKGAAHQRTKRKSAKTRAAQNANMVPQRQLHRVERASSFHFLCGPSPPSTGSGPIPRRSQQSARIQYRSSVQESIRCHEKTLSQFQNKMEISPTRRSHASRAHMERRIHSGERASLETLNKVSVQAAIIRSDACHSCRAGKEEASAAFSQPPPETDPEAELQRFNSCSCQEPEGCDLQRRAGATTPIQEFAETTSARLSCQVDRCELFGSNCGACTLHWSSVVCIRHFASW